MWVRVGAKTLFCVLEQIQNVISPKFVNRRIIVDDESTDDTRKIGTSFGWKVVSNEGAGTSDGAKL
jgi:glycosyltransferase involved in cell wall biosynthesis